MNTNEERLGANLPPVNYPMPGPFRRWLAGRRGLEFDTYGGSWVRRGWIQERQELTDRALADPYSLTGYAEIRYADGRIERRPLDPGQVISTCNLCRQPMELHTDPRRVWTADPAYCPLPSAIGM